MNKRLLWQKAAAFSARAHQHQLRHDKRTPYVSHPMRVALTIACVFGFQDERVLAAALLHDVIEDTGADYDDIHGEFGKPVADLVAAMTKDMRLIESKREAAYDRQLAAAPWQARLIKLADVFDNLHDCTEAAARRKMLERARRIVKLTADDRQLSEARRIVADLGRVSRRK